MKNVSVLATLLVVGALSGQAWATDNDHDGHPSIATGGDDCDDANANRFPGNAEICDTVDNDCDPATIGWRDADGDGVTSGACCNIQSTRWVWTGSIWFPISTYKCGTDCDDLNRSLILSSQRCEAGTDRVELCGGPSAPGDDGWYAVDCGDGMTCAEQPNGTGVCR